MKKFIVLVLVIFIVGCSPKACNPNNQEICLDEVTSRFIIEENAQIRVMADSVGYKEALEELWRTNNPEYKDLLKVEVFGEELSDKDYDLVFLTSHQAALYSKDLLVLPEVAQVEIYPHLATNFTLDKQGLFFLPITAYGTVFATNKSYLSENGLSVVDENNDGLVDEYDSVEEIYNADMSFPICFDDPLFTRAFSLLDFELFENDPLNTFNSEEFLAALTSLSELGKLAKSGEWNYEMFFDLDNMPFSQIGTWMYYNNAKSEVTYSDLPSYLDKHFNQYAYPSGYSINASTKYPNAALEVLRLMYSKQGLQAYANTSDNLLVYNQEVETITEDDEVILEAYNIEYKTRADQEVARALSHSIMEKYEALEYDLKYRYYDSLDIIDYQAVIKDVFNQNISPVDAKTLLEERFQTWINTFIGE